jgi:hypothetical protein
MATTYSVERKSNDDWMIAEMGERNRSFGPYQTRDAALEDAMKLARSGFGERKILVATDDGRGSRVYWSS